MRSFHTHAHKMILSDALVSQLILAATLLISIAFGRCLARRCILNQRQRLREDDDQQANRFETERLQKRGQRGVRCSRSRIRVSVRPSNTLVSPPKAKNSSNV